MQMRMRNLLKMRRGGLRLTRKGVIIPVVVLCLPVLLAFIAFAVDTGLMSLATTRMQNAVDAAALAAAQEIIGAVNEAGEGEGDLDLDANSTAVANARQTAYEVALANGTLIDPVEDVTFGKRVYDPDTGTWPILWGAEPYNVIKVAAHREKSAEAAQSVEVPGGSGKMATDAKLPLYFGWAIGKPNVGLSTSATAFVEARDIVVVLDYSGSMNDDSSMVSFSIRGQATVEAALDAMWQAMVDDDPQWPGTSESKFPASGFGNVNSAYGTYVSSSTTSTILSNLQLNARNGDGTPKYPFPQAGKYASGEPKPRPSASTSDSLWTSYISYVKSKSGTYNKRYGYRTLMDYLQEQRYLNSQSEDLWRTPHYPLHAIKEGTTLFLSFLTDLDFGDEVGLVSYASTAQWETTLDEVDASVDISGNPITSSYSDVDTIQRHKQAGHYSSYTNMGDGIQKAKELLASHARYLAKPTMLVMTDGNTNQRPYGWSLPSGWDWDELTDYDGDGNADYTTSDQNKQYAFWEAKRAIDAGITIHTMSVGAGADRDLMKAIAFAGGGVWINIPGDTTIEEMQAEVLEAFSQIAAKVPPAKLCFGATTSE
jgi:hypothetical protein